VNILTGAKVTMIEPTRVIYEHGDGSVGEVPVDRVALAIGWRPAGERTATWLDQIETHIIGDAKHATDFVAAINAGADAGLTV
jgi:hypothetical protein